MNQRHLTIIAVYLSGFLAGIALILFPSAGALFQNQDLHALSSSQYGVLFTPQTITAIGAAFLAARFAARFGMKAVLRGGLICLSLAMGLAMLSHLALDRGDLPFFILLAATACVGAGFGLTITALNAYAVDLFPGKENSAVTAAHIMTGLGQVGAALILSFFTAGGEKIDSWWGAPLTVALVVVGLIAFQYTLPLQLSSESQSQPRTMKGLPWTVWIYAGLVFLYGAVEGTFGNFTTLYLKNDALLSPADAALGLSFFWGAVTGGRFLFTLLALRRDPHFLYPLTPLIFGSIFLILPALEGRNLHLAAFALAGLALSFFFPYTISLATTGNSLQTPAISGTLVAAIQLGNGFSGNAVGMANESLALTTIFRFSAIYAVIMLAGILYLAKEQKHD